MKYVYDGTFAGFLSAVYRIYHDGTGQMVSISASRGSGDLFGEETEVATDMIIANGGDVRILQDIFENDYVGTLFTANENANFNLANYIMETIG